jgi:3-polyprenyl-4-hydroxybenzoate decarboxylase
VSDHHALIFPSSGQPPALTTAALTHRKDAVYPAIVGIPPMEDFYKKRTKRSLAPRASRTIRHCVSIFSSEPPVVWFDCSGQ